jgi:tartronate-semialdehyde synthase
MPESGIVSHAKAALLFVEVARERQAAGKLKGRTSWQREGDHRKKNMLRKTHYDAVPLKPQRVYEEMNETFGRDTCDVTTIGL